MICHNRRVTPATHPLGVLVPSSMSMRRVLGNMQLPETDGEDPSVVPFPFGEVRCRKRLGGLLRHYYRDAA